MGRVAKIAGNLGAVLVLLALGELGGSYVATIILTALVVATLALSWDVLSRCGLVSVGQGAVFGFSAYGYALLRNVNLGPSIAGAIVCVGVVCLALIFGFVTLRLRGIYFALVTLALAAIGPAIILLMPGLTGGASGLVVPLLSGGSISGQLVYLAIGLGLCVTVSEIIRLSRWGVVFYAVRDAPEVARASGLSVARWRVGALCISWCMAAIAGSLYSGLYGTVNYDDVLGFTWSVSAIAACVIGGSDSTFGSILGASFVVGLGDSISSVGDGAVGQIIYGALIAIVILFFQGGVVGRVNALAGRIKAGHKKQQLKNVRRTETLKGVVS